MWTVHHMKEAGETSYANYSSLYPIIAKLTNDVRVTYNYGYVKGMYCQFRVSKFS